MRVLIIRAFILSCLAPFALAPQALAAAINVTASATDTLNGANGLRDEERHMRRSREDRGNDISSVASGLASWCVPCRFALQSNR